MAIKEQCILAKKAAPSLAMTDSSVRNAALICAGEDLKLNSEKIIYENIKDLKNAKDNGIPDPMIDRLMLNKERIEKIADSLFALAKLPDPLGNGTVIKRPNGLEIKKIKVPIGLIAIIYESRPNVTADAAGLCIKSGNAVVLRGGKEALNSNLIIAEIFRKAISKVGLDPELIQIAKDTSRTTAQEIMRMRGIIDLLIPRGGKGLIRSVVENATVPTVETGAGNCFAYVEKSADFDKAIKIIVNAKTSRPAVCNALEHLLVDEDIANEFLPIVKNALPNVTILASGNAAKILGVREVTDDEFFTEYDDLILSVKTVSGIDEAINFIGEHSTGHSEVIITENLSKAEKFTSSVDSAAVYVNASTRFTDGGEFGFGAEIGISTQKLHARGPMGLSELTAVKYVINGNGQIR